MGSAKLRPSVRLAVLGLMLERPSYGYELVARFRRVFADQPWRWRVTPQAIYGALNDLERDGLIEPNAEPAGSWADSAQRRQRQTFRVTGEGARAMREWLASPMPSNPSRQELLIRLHFGERDDAALRDMLRRHAEACVDELERIAAEPSETRMQRLVKEDRRLAVQARLSWIGLAPLLASLDEQSVSDDLTPVLSLSRVTKRYRHGLRDVTALRDVSMQLRAGEVVCVTGRRGSGRTTLLRVVAGLDQPDEGTIHLAGDELPATATTHRQRIAFCNTRFVPTHGRDACEHVLMPLLAIGVSRDEAGLRAHRALERVGAAELAFTAPDEWLPSEAVRVSVARSIVREPRVLLIDEPVSGVDPTERDPLLAIIQRVTHESGIATLLTAGETTSVTGADRVMRLSDGELIGRAPRSGADVVHLRRPASESSR